MAQFSVVIPVTPAAVLSPKYVCRLVHSVQGKGIHLNTAEEVLWLQNPFSYILRRKDICIDREKVVK